jgi:hypothetical protein
VIPRLCRRAGATARRLRRTSGEALVLVLSVKAALPWLAAPCRSFRKSLPLVTSDGSMLPPLALSIRPETDAENFAIGAASIKKTARQAEHQPAGAPVGQVQECVEVPFHRFVWAATEVAVVVFVDEPGGGDLRPTRQLAQLRALLGSQRLSSARNS